MAIPETRPSILIRLRDHSDREAWQHFEDVYRGVIARVAIRYGMQEADAADLGQDVLIRISKGIEQFDPLSNQARFRTWLSQVVRSAIVDWHRRKPRDQGSGLTEIQDQLGELADPQFSESLEQERRSEVFRWAARRIRSEFAEQSWQSFWLTTVQHQSVEDVAEQLGRSVGAVYTSRSRIMRRLRDEVCLFDQEAIRDDL